MKFAAPPAWLLVLTGLILNVLALLMSSIVLDRLSGDIAALSEQKDDNIYSIQLAWNSVETLERKREMVLLHLSQSGGKPITDKIGQMLQGQLSDWVSVPVPVVSPSTLPDLMMLINQTQQSYRNQIDEHYLNNITLSEKMVTLNEKIAWYKNIGLFLQVFGLALILARDLARKPE